MNYLNKLGNITKAKINKFSLFFGYRPEDMNKEYSNVGEDLCEFVHDVNNGVDKTFHDNSIFEELVSDDRLHEMALHFGP